MDTISVRIEKSGRVLIPAVIRRRLNLEEGNEVLLRIDDTGIQMGTRQQALDRIQKRLRQYIPEDRVLSEELIEERRAEADREDRQ
jgi:AbrB family looped-hinge helix DNA binding protein